MRTFLPLSKGYCALIFSVRLICLTNASISVKVAFDEEGGVTLSDYEPTAYDDYVKTGDHTVTTTE